MYGGHYLVPMLRLNPQPDADLEGLWTTKPLNGKLQEQMKSLDH